MRPEWNGDRVRDDYEIGLYRAFVALGKPVLGVCRGAQLINVAQGGTLYQDIGTQVPHALNHRNWEIYAENCHATSIVPGSGLARLYPATPLVKTNSVHHQAVKDLGRDLVVEAWSEPDRLVEALRWTGSVVRLRRPVASGIPPAGGSLVHRRHPHPRRFPRGRVGAQGRGVRPLGPPP